MTDRYREILESLERPNLDVQELARIRFKDPASLIILALWCGWNVHVHKQWFFIAHDGTRLEIPTNNNLNIKVYRSKVRTIIRHRDPNALGRAPIGAVINEVILHNKLDHDHAQILRQALRDELNVTAFKPAPPAEAAPAPDPTPLPGWEGVVVPEVHTLRPREIIRQEPWAAHGHVGSDGISRTYPSEAVVEREWSDKTIDYACADPECDYTNDVPRSVSSHFASKHRRGLGRAEQPPADDVDPEWTPQRKAQVARLRRELDGALNAALAQGIDWAVEDQAKWLAEWIVEHRADTPVSGSDETDPADLTPEQILDRIGALVDRGRGKLLREQIDRLSTRVDDYMEALDEARTEAARATARAEHAENDLRAVREMLSDYDKAD
jgi:hypothetical protein